MTDMTDAQIANWRNVLTLTIGPFAYLLSREEIIAIRDRMQAHAESLSAESPEEKYCTCDRKKHGYTIHKDDRVTCNKCHKERQAE